MRLRLLSLFSGIGSFEKALANLGVDYEVANFSEIDKCASIVYNAINGTDEGLNLGDINKIDIKNISTFNIMTYGFPCQDISNAGYCKGFKDGTRSNLLWKAMEIAEYHRPDFLVAENVRSILNNRFREGLIKWNALLEDLGYNNTMTVMNPVDYGIPQNRERLFVFSIKKGCKNIPEIVKPNNVSFSIKDLLEKDVQASTILGSSTKARMDKLVLEKNCRPRGYIPTITTEVSKGSGRYFMPYWIKEIGEYRRPTPLECFRFMGFQDEDYIKAKDALIHRKYNGKDRTNKAMYRLAANAIVVPVIENLFYDTFRIIK